MAIVHDGARAGATTAPRAATMAPMTAPPHKNSLRHPLTVALSDGDAEAQTVAKEKIRSAIERAHGSLVKTSELLGCSRATCFRLIELASLERAARALRAEHGVKGPRRALAKGRKKMRAPRRE
jgi:transcriptional regulator of acetoin/glycerol metabolism